MSRDIVVHKKKKHKEVIEIEGVEVSEDMLDNKLRKLTQRMKGLKSTFKASVGGIVGNLESGDTDRGISIFQKAMLATMLELIPIAEDQYRNSEGNANLLYALNAAISQSRELIADVDAGKDYAQLVQRLSVQVLEPIFLSLANNAVSEIFRFAASIDGDIQPDRRRAVKDALNTLARDLAKLMQSAMVALNTQIQDELT